MSCEKIITNGEINSQIFIILQLKHRPSGKLVTVVGVHLKSKEPNYEKRQHQIEEVLKAIKLHCSNLKDFDKHPLLLCGDFNGAPFEKFYQTITEDAELNHLVDAYSVNVKKKEPTTIKIRNGSMLRREIDYIFFNRAALQLQSLLELPHNDEIIERQGLPNLKYSSDHLSLVCDFKLI